MVNDPLTQRQQVNSQTVEQVREPKKNPGSSSVGRRKKTTQTRSISLTQLSGFDVKDASTQTNGTPYMPRNEKDRISAVPNTDEVTISTIAKPPRLNQLFQS